MTMDIRSLISAKQRTVVLYVRTRPVRAAVIGIIAVWAAIFIIGRVTATPTATRYVLTKVTRGTLVESVSGTGQVSVSDTLDIKPKTSGDVLSVAVTPGQTVKAGAVIARLDPTDAQNAVRDAQIALQDAQVALQKLQLSQSTGLPELQDNLAKTYQNTFNTITSAFLGLPDIVDGARGVLYDSTLKGACAPNACQYANLVPSDDQQTIKDLTQQAENDYDTAKSAYDPALATYRTTTRDDGADAITALTDSSLDAVRKLAQAVKSEQNMLDAVVADMNLEAQKQGLSAATIPAQVTAYQTAVGDYSNQLNGFVMSLADARSSITSDVNALATAQDTNPLDLASQQNAVEQKQAALSDAQLTLSETVIRAPFDGTVAKVDVQKGDSASAGSAVATIITDQTVADIELNEVDVSKVAVGQKATLTFDAVSGLTLSGTVAQVDPVGTVSQGVVSYAVEVTMDTQDSRVRAGMTTSVSIVTDVKSDVLLVPGSAVRTSGGTSSVQVVANAPQNGLDDAQGVVLPTVPPRVTVEIGASSDSQTEITSGLNEGDVVVTRTITATAATTTSTTSSQVRIPGAGGGFGGGGLGR
ncbi:MAG TPA: efflux RND transporter periplasmic adaptor subunit [Candidatus Paceibacterota bacterium]|nr:efflux RND transporter periplasmic adaptor subunit [Candidatus Paceibacterota bacterium]